MDALIWLKQSLFYVLSWLGEGLLYFTSFGLMAVLLGSAIGISAWLLMKFLQSSETDTQAGDKPVSPEERNAHKRAGQ